MGVRALLGGLLLCLAGSCALADEIADCERRLVQDAKPFGTGVKSAAFSRGDIRFDKYEGKVGGSFVSSVIYGPADVKDGSGSRRVDTVCLHGGVGKGALFVWMLP